LKGHDFSRAENVIPEGRALAPAGLTLGSMLPEHASSIMDRATLRRPVL